MTGWASARQAPLNRQLTYQEAMVRSIQPHSVAPEPRQGSVRLSHVSSTALSRYPRICSHVHQLVCQADPPIFSGQVNCMFIHGLLL